MTQLRKYDFSGNWWPVATSNFSVVGDCTATVSVPAQHQGIAFGLSLSAAPESADALECGVKVAGPYLTVIHQGAVVKEIYPGVSGYTVAVSRVGNAYTITLGGSTIYTGTGSTARVWMAACLFDTGDVIDASLVGTHAASGPATGVSTLGTLNSRGSQGKAPVGTALLSRLSSIALGGAGLLNPAGTVVLKAITGSGHVPGWFGADHVESMSLSTTMDADVFAGTFNTEQLGVIATMSGQIIFNVTMVETLQVLSMLTTGATVNALMYSTLTASDEAQYAGAYALTWAVNADTGATSMYEGYDLNSMGKWGVSQYVGARNDGIYLMEGGTDDGVPIHASMAFGAKTFGTLQKKTVQHAYLGVASGGGLYARITVDSKTYTYKVRRNSDVLQTQRIDMGRGLQATHVVLELLNENGADFELADIEFNIAVLARRI